MIYGCVQMKRIFQIRNNHDCKFIFEMHRGYSVFTFFLSSFLLKYFEQIYTISFHLTQFNGFKTFSSESDVRFEKIDIFCYEWFLRVIFHWIKYFMKQIIMRRQKYLIKLALYAFYRSIIQTAKQNTFENIVKG